VNNQINYHQVIHALAGNKLPYAVLTLQHGVKLILSQFGGRVLGPFLTEESASLYWLPPAFAGPQALKDFLAAGETGLGGERYWITPEVQYNIRDRARWDATYALPSQLDPGHYALEQTRPDEWRLAQDVTLDAFNTASGRKDLHIEIVMHPVDDPLRTLSRYDALLDGVTYAGYEQVITLSERVNDGILSESWNLIQVNPGGMMLIPATAAPEWRDYYEPAEDGQEFHPGHVRVHITGQRRYKLGYQAAQNFGRLAYFNTLDQGQAYLLVRSFFNNPSSLYIEEAAPTPWPWGDSVHIYNDRCKLGGFGELYVHGQTIGGPTRRSTSQDQMVLWLYAGPTARIKALAAYLLGITLD